MYVNTTTGERSRFLYYSKDCAGTNDCELGDFGDNRCCLGSAVCHFEADFDSSDFAGKLFDLRSIYLRDKCGVDYIDGEDRARICGEKFRNCFAGGCGFGFVECGFGKVEVKKDQFRLTGTCV